MGTVKRLALLRLWKLWPDCGPGGLGNRRYECCQSRGVHSKSQDYILSLAAEGESQLVSPGMQRCSELVGLIELDRPRPWLELLAIAAVMRAG